MGFLDGLCDLPDDAEPITWPSFLRLETVCSLTAVGAAASGVLALLSFFAVLIQRCLNRPRGGRRRGAGKGANGNGGPSKPLAPRSSLNDNGTEESKGGRDDVDEDDDEEFMSRATEPLLSSSGGDRDYAEDSELEDEYDEEEEEEEAGEWSRGGKGGKTAKKGTGVHWAKLLLYWAQASYHLGLGAYYLVDGRATEPYQCECARARGGVALCARVSILWVHAREET